MKKIFSTVMIAITSILYSQVIIGDAIGTATNKTSVLLEFANSNDKGLILPYVRTLPKSPAPGTIVMDSSNPVSSKVKYYDGNDWKQLSGESDLTSILVNQPAIAESAEAKAIIGSDSSSADGVLVLESTTKAMVLPVVTDVQNIPDPSPGMMVYVKGTKKYLAVFDGSKWAFWNP